MQTDRELREEDFAVLPSFARAFGCGCDSHISTGRVSVTPPFLQFPHDDFSKHIQKIVIWNKTTNYMEVRIDQPKNSDVFQAYCFQSGVHGGAGITIYVKCTPEDRKMCFDCLRIRIAGDLNPILQPKSKCSKKIVRYDPDFRGEDILSLPLQLFPGIGWFLLPKFVVMPSISVGEAAEVVVGLPEVIKPEKFFISARTSSPQHAEAFSITPYAGVLGEGGADEMIIRYTPTQYVTMVHSINIHFPALSSTPHEMIIYARAAPGLTSDNIFREVAMLNSYVEQTKKRRERENRRIPMPELIYRKKGSTRPNTGLSFPCTGGGDRDDVLRREWEEEDLTKPAGVMHFLTRRPPKTVTDQEVMTDCDEEFPFPPLGTEISGAETTPSKTAVIKVDAETSISPSKMDLVSDAGHMRAGKRRTSKHKSRKSMTKKLVVNLDSLQKDMHPNTPVTPISPSTEDITGGTATDGDEFYSQGPGHPASTQTPSKSGVTASGKSKSVVKSKAPRQSSAKGRQSSDPENHVAYIKAAPPQGTPRPQTARSGKVGPESPQK